MKLVISISGASGVNLGVKFIEYLPSEIQKYLILTDSARVVFERELRSLEILNDLDISEAPASGSFQVDAMAIIPCSMNTLAKIAVGISDNLTTRSAQVTIKEKRKLLIAPREMPFSEIHLENMLKLSKVEGVSIAPPILGYYSNQESLEEMEKFIVGKWFDILNIKHNLYQRWGS